ncbi:MAG: MMPL family transporter [Pseudomonadales bacterium]
MSALGRVLSRWVEVCEHRPRTILAALVATSLLAAVYVSLNFSIDSDLGKLIRPSEALTWYRANERYKAAFPELQETSLVVVSGGDATAVERTAMRLQAAFSESGRFQFVFAPALSGFLRDHRAYFLDEALLSDWVAGVQYDYGALLRLADGADLANAAFTLADQVSATDGLRIPTVLRSLMEAFADGVPDTLTVAAYPHLVPEADVHYLIMMLKGHAQLDQRLPNAAQVSLIRSLVDTVAVEPGVRVRLTGEVPLAHEEIGMALDGIGIAGTLSLVLLALILHFGVGSWRIIGATFALLGTGVLLTLAFAVATVGAFNTLALIFVVMFFGLGVDFAVHFSLRMREGLAPGSTEDAEVHFVREVGPALALCMLTSAIAFLSFAPTPYRGLGELGIVSAGGMVIALLLTLTLLPAFYSLFGMPVSAGAVRQRAWRWQGRPVPVLIGAGLLALIAAWLAKDVRFDYSVLALRDSSTEAMSTLLELQANGVTTDYSINVLAPDDDEARRLKRRLEALPEVGDVLIPSDLVPADQPAKALLLAELEALLADLGVVQPADGSMAVEGLTEAVRYLEEVRGEVPEAERALFDAFLDGLEELSADPDRLATLNRELVDGITSELGELERISSADPFRFDDLPADLQARLVSPEGWQLLTVLPAGIIDSRAATDRFVGAVTSIEPEAGGRAMVEWGVGGVAVRSFVEALSLAIVAIAVLLVVYFRGVVLPLIVLVPLSLTTLVTFAVIQITPLTLNMANILVMPLIFGLGVDTGIHVVHRYRTDGDVAALLGSSTAHAVVISALTTIGTFFSLSFSPHKGAASVGMLLTIAISVMLVVTFLVVPALLSVLPDRLRRGVVSRGQRS